jgi:hypothetical protein
MCNQLSIVSIQVGYGKQIHLTDTNQVVATALETDNGHGPPSVHFYRMDVRSRTSSHCQMVKDSIALCYVSLRIQGYKLICTHRRLNYT